MHLIGYDAIVAGQRWALDSGPAPLAIYVIDLAVVIAAECNAAVMSVAETGPVTMTYAMLRGRLVALKSSASGTRRLETALLAEPS